MTDLFALAFTAAVSGNAVLQMGFGFRSASRRASLGTADRYIPAAASFAAALVCWALFTYALAPLSLGALEPLLLFPLASAVSLGIDKLAAASLGKAPYPIEDSALSAFDGLAFAASWLAIRLASGFPQALAVASGAALGILACSAALHAVAERADTEAVPRSLRGTPLNLIAASLLSLASLLVARSIFAASGLPS